MAVSLEKFEVFFASLLKGKRETIEAILFFVSHLSHHDTIVTLKRLTMVSIVIASAITSVFISTGDMQAFYISELTWSVVALLVAVIEIYKIRFLPFVRIFSTFGLASMVMFMCIFFILETREVDFEYIMWVCLFLLVVSLLGSLLAILSWVLLRIIQKSLLLMFYIKQLIS